MVADALLGADFRTVVVAGRAYTIHPPTIERLAGAIHYLSEVRDAQTVREVLLSLGDMDKLSAALSWFIAGDDSLSAHLAKGTLDEVADALDAAVGMIDIKVFLKAVSSARSASLLAARPR